MFSTPLMSPVMLTQSKSTSDVLFTFATSVLHAIVPSAATTCSTCHSCSEMQVAGSDWKLVQEGHSAEVNQEPQFSTWEDVVNKKKSRKSNGASTSESNSDSRSRSAQASSPSTGQASAGSRRGKVLDDSYYRCDMTTTPCKPTSYTHGVQDVQHVA